MLCYALAHGKGQEARQRVFAVLWRMAKPMSARQSRDAHGKEGAHGKETIIVPLRGQPLKPYPPVSLSLPLLDPRALLLCIRHAAAASSPPPLLWPAPAAALAWQARPASSPALHPRAQPHPPASAPSGQVGAAAQLLPGRGRHRQLEPATAALPASSLPGRPRARPSPRPAPARPCKLG
jgi:hypothetical protein